MVDDYLHENICAAGCDMQKLLMNRKIKAPSMGEQTEKGQCRMVGTMFDSLSFLVVIEKEFRTGIYVDLEP